MNALGQAFSRRSDEQRDSTRAHQVSLGAFALENALARGQPYAQAASLLAQSCREDELVSAALQALPKESADKARGGTYFTLALAGCVILCRSGPQHLFVLTSHP